MFITRTISGIVILAIMVAAVILGQDVLYALMVFLVFIGLYELYKTYNIHNNRIGGAGYAGALLYLLAVRFDVHQGTMLALVMGFLILMFVYVFSFPKYPVSQVVFGVFGIIYVPVLLSYLYQIRMLRDGLFLIPLAFICAWGNDTCAYCVGMLIGKHKMAPRLSPKKSIEGAVGGVAGAILLGMIYGYICGKYMPTIREPILVCGIIGGVGALIAIVGDLTASAIKRDTGIKDYGKLIPGHGGVLDRFDSVLFTAPAVYFLAVYLSSY